MTDNVQIVRDSIEFIWNNAELDRVPEFYTEEFVSHQGGYGLWPWRPGHEGLRERVLQTKEVFPDYHEEIELITGGGDIVAVRMTISALNSGDGLFPASSKRFAVKDMMFCKLKDGKLHEQWGLTDFYTMFIELGLMKPLF